MMHAHAYPEPHSWPYTIVAGGFYILVALSGLVVAAFILLHEPETAAGRMILVLWSVATIIPGAACAYGVLSNRYRWEWVGCWPLLSGIGVYASSVWLSMASIWDLANCLLITALMLIPLQRSIWLSIVDRNARRRLMRKVAREVRDE